MARVVVVGGGIGGLACALLLAPRGHDVTVLDRDPADLPATAADAWARWPRKGVPQFRHIHLFNARGRKVLAEEAPEVLRALKAEGAGEIHFAGPDDDELVRLTCRRTTYELVLRRAVLGDERVRFIGGACVVGLHARGNRIVGARTDDGVDWPADLVVDASGRRSDVATWLAASGRPPPTYEEDAAGSVGYTRWYRQRDGDGDSRTAPLVRADLGYAAGVVAPADDGMFCVAFGALAEDLVMRRLRATTAFDAAVAAVPSIAEWTAPDRAVPETDVLTMADRANRLVRLPPTPGLVLLGDAAMCTNPGYGRGVGLALVHAQALAGVLEVAGDDPQRVATAFERATRTELEPWYWAAVAGDEVRRTIARRLLAGEPWASIGGPADSPAARFARGSAHAVEHDPVVRRAFHRCFQLLDPPSAFWGSDDIRARVEALWTDVERSPPPPAGPDHAAMGRLLAALP